MEAVKNFGQRDLKTSSIIDCEIILCDDGFQICKVIYMWFVSSNQGQKDFFFRSEFIYQLYHDC